MKNLLLFIILLTNFMFSSEPVLVGSAKLDTTNQLNWKDFYLLTPDNNNVRGALWSPTPLSNFHNNFTLTITANFGQKTINGADGIALVFHRDPRSLDSVIGSYGGGIGYGYVGFGTPDYNFDQRIENSFAIEFDTYYNGTWDTLHPYIEDLFAQTLPLMEWDHADIRFNGNLTNISANK